MEDTGLFDLRWELCELEDSEFEFDDRNNEPNYVLNDESENYKQQDKGEIARTEDG